MNNLSVVVVAGSDDVGLNQMLDSVVDIANEIVVIDTGLSETELRTVKKFNAKVIKHKPVSFVEKIRNFAISKATKNWVLIMDPDEEIQIELRKEIELVIKKNKADYFRIPRKNIIFDKWIKHSRWWPDYNIRLFKKGFVSWNEIIHAVPITTGVGADFSDKESLAIVHNSYHDIDEYFSKMFRYTKGQAENIRNSDYKFLWSDLITKPLNEFLSRFFAGKGYKDGVHGLALSLLQAFSELILYIRLWNYKKEDIDKSELNSAFNKSIKDLKWWMRKEFSWLKNLPFVS